MSVPMCPSVCLSQHYESVELASAETSKAGLRASSFWLDRSLCCSWETRQQREEKREQTLLLLLLLSSPLSHSFAPSSSPCFLFISSLCLCLPRFLLSFFCCTVLCCPPSPPPSNSSCSLFLSSLSLGLCTAVRRCWHSGTADGPL